MQKNSKAQSLVFLGAVLIMLLLVLISCVVKNENSGSITQAPGTTSNVGNDLGTPDTVTTETPITSTQTQAPVTTAPPSATVPATTVAVTTTTMAPVTTIVTTAPVTTTTALTTTIILTTTTVPVTTVPITTAPITTTPVTTAPQAPERDPNAKLVAFSFDDGPNSALTKKFVDKLKEYGATATFFVVGERMGKTHGQALQYAVDNGCEVGLHSYDHTYYNKMTMDEYLADLAKTEAAIKKYVNVDIRLMRPPGGILSTAQKEACPYTAVKWSVDSNDWQYVGRGNEETRKKNVNTIVNNVMKNIKSGDIVLMHELYTNSYEAFCIIIEQLYEQGYEIVTVGELLGEAKIVPGKLYYNGR